MKTDIEKGNWNNNGLEVRSQSGMILANVYKHLKLNQSKEEAIQIAKLISAAPELLKSLIRSRDWMINKGINIEGEIFKELEQSISKATKRLIK